MKRSCVVAAILMTLAIPTLGAADESVPAAKASPSPASAGKPEPSEPTASVSATAGATEAGSAVGALASFELPKDSSLDMSVLAGHPLLRAHIGGEVLPVRVIRKEIRGKNGAISYQLDFVPMGEIHLDFGAFKEAPDAHAFATPSMASTVELDGKSYVVKVRFLLSPVAVGVIRTESKAVVTFGGQTGLGLSVAMRVSDADAVEAGIDASTYRDWVGDSVHAVDLDGSLRVTHKTESGQVISLGAAGQYEGLSVHDRDSGLLMDLDRKYYVGATVGIAW